MTDPIIPELTDNRTDAPMTGGEAAVLAHWLDLYRETVLLKIAGLDAEQLCERSVSPSTMSLIGVVRHLTEVEAYWLREVLEGEPDVPDYYSTPGRPDGDFDEVDPSTAGAARANKSTCAGSSCTSSRNTPGTLGTWTCCASGSMAARAIRAAGFQRRQFTRPAQTSSRMTPGRLRAAVPARPCGPARTAHRQRFR